MFYLTYRTRTGEHTVDKPALDEIRNYEKFLSQLAGVEVLGVYEDERPLSPEEGAEWGPKGKHTGRKPIAQQRAPEQVREVNKKYKFKDQDLVWGAPPKMNKNDLRKWGVNND
jgi:hypothetical protein